MDIAQPTREALLHRLYEAAELEHNLMCTYLYAAFSLKDAGDGLAADEAAATARWRRTILEIAIEEMGHLCAVWNITCALGGAPRFGRGNFPLDPGYLPAGVVLKLAPFNAAVLQHFIHLERPKDSAEPDGEGFEPPVRYRRGSTAPRLTPMGTDYDTVGDFYASLGESVRHFVERVGEKAAFCGDPALQLSADEIDLGGARPVICAKTALAAFDAIVRQGEGAQADSEGSHYQKFSAIRRELRALEAGNAAFQPAFPASVNPVLRRPPRPEGRVWIENEEAAQCVDLANAAYGLMVRLIGYSYGVPRPAREKAVAVDLGIGLMKAMTLLAERAARLPAGPSNPQCHAGVTFVALRDAAAFPPGAAARRFFSERLTELARGAATLEAADERIRRAARVLGELAERSHRDFADASSLGLASAASRPTAAIAPAPSPPHLPPQRPRAWKRSRARRSPCSSTRRSASIHASASLGHPTYFSPTCKDRGSTPTPWTPSASSKSRMSVRRARSVTGARTAGRMKAPRPSISLVYARTAPMRCAPTCSSPASAASSGRRCADVARPRTSHSATARTMR
jgi:hypothetical protein